MVTQDVDGTGGARLVGCDELRYQAGALRHRDGPSDVQEEVAQGARNHLPRNRRFAVATGSLGEGRV